MYYIFFWFLFAFLVETFPINVPKTDQTLVHGNYLLHSTNEASTAAMAPSSVFV